MAIDKDSLAFKLIEKLKERNLPINEGRILDLGCGDGKHLFDFIDYDGFDTPLIGVDKKRKKEEMFFKFLSQYKKVEAFPINRDETIQLQIGEIVPRNVLNHLDIYFRKYQRNYYDDFYKNYQFWTNSKGDLNCFEIIPQSYNWILLIDILHFFNHNDDEFWVKIISKIIDGLKLGGRCFIRVRTVEKYENYSKDDKNHPKHFTKISGIPNGYKHKQGEEIYLFDKNSLEKLKSLFHETLETKGLNSDTSESFIGLFN